MQTEPRTQAQEEAKIRERAKVAELLKTVIPAARRDYNVFANFIGPSIDPRFTQQARIHREWHAHLAANPAAGIVAPQGHGKSVQLMLNALFELGKNPELCVKLVCASDENAVDRVMSFRQIIEKNSRLHMVFPHLRKPVQAEDWSRHSFTTPRKSQAKDSTLEAWGVLSAAAGGRADLIIFDDVVELKNAILNPELRPKVKRAIWDVWMKMLHPGARAWYINTLWHPDDATHDLMENSKWKFLFYAIGEDCEPIWPERWSRETLLAERAANQPSFDRGMRNIVAIDGECPLNKDWLQQFCPDQGRGDVRVTSWDFAPGQGVNSDNIAAVTVDGWAKDKKIVISGIRQFRGLTIHGLAEVIHETQMADQADVVYMQGVNFEIYVSQAIEPSWGIPIETWTPAIGKVERVKQQAPFFQRGHIWFLDTEDGRKLAKRFSQFPALKHDDDIDSASGGIKRVLEALRFTPSVNEVISSGKRGPISAMIADNSQESMYGDDVSIGRYDKVVW